MKFKQIILGTALGLLILVTWSYFQTDSKSDAASDQSTMENTEKSILDIKNTKQFDQSNKANWNRLTTQDIQDQKIIQMTEFISGHLSNAITTGQFLDRQKIINTAARDPLTFVETTHLLLNEIPMEQSELRQNLLSLIVDTIVESRNLNNLPTEIADQVFDHIYTISDQSLRENELIPADMYEKLPIEKKQELAHNGTLIEENGRFYKSTMGEKVMLISLINLDQDEFRSGQYIDGIKNKLSDQDISWLKPLQKQLDGINTSK